MPGGAEGAAANAGQAGLWNGDTGQRWAAAQSRVERAFAPLTEAFLARLPLRPDARVLDVGCGAGDLSLALAARLGPAGHVLGLDISEPLLAVARSRPRPGSAAASVEFLAGDAATLPLPGDRDVLVSRFGVMFFDDPAAAFRHLGTALRPGGRLAMLCWADPGGNAWAGVPAAAIREIAGTPEPLPPGAPGAFAFSDPDRVAAILAAGGFSEIEAGRIEADVVLGQAGSEEDALDEAALYGATLTPAHRLLLEAPDEMLARARARIKDALRPYLRHGAVRLPASCWIYRARKPG